MTTSLLRNIGYMCVCVYSELATVSVRMWFRVQELTDKTLSLW